MRSIKIEKTKCGFCGKEFERSENQAVPFCRDCFKIVTELPKLTQTMKIITATYDKEQYVGLRTLIKQLKTDLNRIEIP